MYYSIWTHLSNNEFSGLTRELKIICLKSSITFWTFFCSLCTRCLFLSGMLWSDVSCRIPFSRFLSHFHYFNLLSQWCILVRSLPTLSFLPWMESAVTTFHLSCSPTLPPHLCTSRPWLLSKWTQNWSAMYRIIAEKIECCVQQELYCNDRQPIFKPCTWTLLKSKAERPSKCHPPWVGCMCLQCFYVVQTSPCTENSMTKNAHFFLCF